MVILGDRYELLGSAIAAMSFRLPIAHIHGEKIHQELLMIQLDTQYQNYLIYTFLFMINIKKDLSN